MIAVVIPCYKVKRHLLEVVNSIGPEVNKIYVVDDCCPQKSGQYIADSSKDPRLHVLFHERNKGVGGAMITGYRQAILDGVKIIVKLDGDGQMDPKLIGTFVEPILTGAADYTKGNRFYRIESLLKMPFVRRFGNSALSIVNKVQSGYWHVMDPTNGYTAIHTEVIQALPLDKIEERYFFESDMLFRLSTVRATVQDIPMNSKYADEQSNLRIGQVLIDFPPKYLNRTFKRIFYNYILRDFNAGTVELFTGAVLFVSGILFGGYHWYLAGRDATLTPTGTVMLAVLLLILGFQLLLAFVQFDTSNVPKTAVYPGLEKILKN